MLTCADVGTTGSYQLQAPLIPLTLKFCFR